jgi:ATP-dependent DNA ligase
MRSRKPRVYNAALMEFDSLPLREGGFIEPMECFAVPKLPDGQQWVYEIKLDGYRAIAVKSAGKLNLLSRRRNSVNRQYPLVSEALVDLPDNTVIDGEVVALDESGRPDFNLLQHYRIEASRIHYFVFDLLILENRDLTRLPLIERRQILNSVLKFQSAKIRIAEYFETSVENILSAVRAQGLEGVVAKKKDSQYEAGKRSGSWVKYRLNSGLISAALVLTVSAISTKRSRILATTQAKAKKDTGIRIIEATYGDRTSHKTCTPNLSICKGSAKCEFLVDDGLCAVDAPVKNLEVIWDCGEGTDKHARAAAKDSRITLECEMPSKLRP